MSLISEYIFEITITGLQPQNEWMWVSYQFGDNMATDFYATRAYDTTHGIGGVGGPTPILNVAADVHAYQRNLPTELRVKVTSLTIPSPSPSDRLIIEFSQSDLNNRHILHHNVTRQGLTTKIDCQCKLGAAGTLQAYDCYNNYIGTAEDPNFHEYPYIVLDQALGAWNEVECFIPHFRTASSTTNVIVTAKVANPRLRPLYVAASETTNEGVIPSLYQGRVTISGFNTFT